MRRLEGWLHQHIFKVGWLLTKNLHTTTILYYTFFLPGVVIHEVIYWLIAGLLNVRADRAITWPEAQAIAELKLNFVQIARNTPRIKVVLISISPLIGGILIIWAIATSVLHVEGFVSLMATGTLDNLPAAINTLTATPDFWLWVYLIFTIANTMMPAKGALEGWRPIAIGIGVVITLFYVVGIGDEVILLALSGPVARGLSLLAGTFAVIIGVNLVMTGALGLIESIIERITGDSATFQNGKLVAMRREEIINARRQQQAKLAKQQQTAKMRPAGPPSIYKLPLPIPGAPGKDAEPVVVAKEESAALSPSPPTDDRAAPAVITGTAVARTEPPPTQGDEGDSDDDDDDDLV